MTLPETLKAARIEAIARAVVAVKCGLQSDQFGVRIPDDIWMQGMPYAERIIAADPLEQIAVELVEALVGWNFHATDCSALHGFDCNCGWLKAQAALQQAGVR